MSERQGTVILASDRDGVKVDTRRLTRFVVTREGQTIVAEPVAAENVSTGSEDSRSPTPLGTEYLTSDDEEDRLPSPTTDENAPVPVQAAPISHPPNRLKPPPPEVDNYLPVPPRRLASPASKPAGVTMQPAQNAYHAAAHSQANRRGVTSSKELQILESAFAQNRWPEVEERDLIGASLGWTSRSVQIWFQNRRRYLKKLWLATHRADEPMPPEMMPPPAHMRVRARLADTEQRKTPSANPNVRARTRKQYASEGGVPQVPSTVQKLIGPVTHTHAPEQIIDAYGLLRQKRVMQQAPLTPGGAHSPQPQTPVGAASPPTSAEDVQKMTVDAEGAREMGGDTRTQLEREAPARVDSVTSHDGTRYAVGTSPLAVGKRPAALPAEEEPPAKRVRRQRGTPEAVGQMVEQATSPYVHHVTGNTRGFREATIGTFTAAPGHFWNQLLHASHKLGLSTELGSSPHEVNKHLHVFSMRLFAPDAAVACVAVRPPLAAAVGVHLAAVGDDAVWFVNHRGRPVWVWGDPSGAALRCVSWGMMATAAEPLVGYSVAAVAGDSGDIHLLCPEEMRSFHTIHGHTKRIDHLAFSPVKPSWLLSGGVESTIYLWDISVPVRPEHNGLRPSVNCLAMIPTTGPTLALAWANSGMYFNTSSGGAHPLLRKFYLTDISRKENEVPMQPHRVKRASRTHSSVETLGGAVTGCAIGLGSLVLTIADVPIRHNLMCSVLDRAAEADRPGYRDATARILRHPSHNPVCAMAGIFPHVMAAPRLQPIEGRPLAPCSAITITFDGCVAVAGYADGRLALYNMRRFLAGGGLLCTAPETRPASDEITDFTVVPAWELEYKDCTGAAITTISISDSGALIAAGTADNRVLIFHSPVEGFEDGIW